MDNIIHDVAARLSLNEKGVSAVIKLLDEGATVPFISRYRKEATGALDEVAVRSVETTLKSVRELYTRKEFVADAITAAGAMTAKLEESLRNARSMTEVEDIYAPFKPKKRTRATIARERGLEPLARIIMAGNTPDPLRSAERFTGNKDMCSAEDALAGARDIIAEWASESTRLRNMTRNTYRRQGAIVCTAAKEKDEELKASPYAAYAAFSNSVRRITSHQYLALRRAESEGMIKVKYSLDDSRGKLEDALSEAYASRLGSQECRKIVSEAVTDASRRLIRPSVENEVSAELKEEADRVAIDIFSQNLRQLLLASPLKGRRILALDPGYRTGCKTVAIDEKGDLLDDAVIYPTPPRNDIEGAHKTLKRMIDRFGLNAVAIGNGTASRETERFIRNSGLMVSDMIFVVSEDGASVYSASETARLEFPDKDVTVRGAVSIGRRLLDPLAELVKIDPKSIGVGQYQHDVDQSKLKNALDYTVMSCVNAVGVDVNTASASLLAYVSGIGPALAANIVKYRTENGSFATRNDLKKVPRLGAKAFEQAAGFLRIISGSEPLDNTGIHPESYAIVKEMARLAGVKVKDLPGNTSILDSIDPAELSAKGLGGLETIADIVEELRKPGRDPRTDNAETAFTPGVESFEELRVGQKLPGIVSNITAFGAFIDLGIKENGLLHISRISTRRINSVGDVLRLGQHVEVSVIEIDSMRRRISLSMI
ncbi:RNA-binding transcriptional accessory protein [Muribaculaceae bacterium Isolate-113 (HZI)]|uniref:Tex family protein n=1 Tax=Sangeribacter muris TaxID=2880703 RepID=UPI000F4A6BCD|nr:Tex family protein [Sangeribacter muris]ROT21941.1 RNA-binding transcriptional accessory protein [Muribaculaceae bacterium Isolate-113 (HZI)]ROT24213.1 RNA-binding transcriptional accessory protein [Muribaculaceae bacterium Isolate-114 (HZI)]